MDSIKITMNLNQKLSPASFVLASVLMSYPMDDNTENVRVLMEDADVDMPEALKKMILAKTSAENIHTI